MTDKKYSILIIDDDKFLLEMYSLKFTEKGFTAQTAESGPSALAKLDAGLNPDIYLVDIVMSGMDGFELIQHLLERQKGQTKKMIIVLSNLGQKEDVEKGLALGADGYIVKVSATPSEVVDRVLEIAGGKK